MSMYNMKINQSNVLNTKYGRAKINNNGRYQITTRKEGNNMKYLHRLIYEDNYGSIPKGYDVHHHDENKLNNCISNLELISKPEHNSYHNTGNKHPRFNPCIPIRKRKRKDTKQGFVYVAQPYTKDGKLWLSSTNLDKCIQKVEDFINSTLNTLGYKTYEIKE